MQSFAVIPAAGHSRRMGQHKLLMPWGDGTIIQHVLNAWQASSVNQIVVVVREDDSRLVEVCRAAGIEPVVANEPPPEMKDSIALALWHIERTFSPSAADVWLLAPADMPGISSRVIDRLLAAHDAASPQILVPTFNQRRGHPVLFPWPIAAEVHSLADDQGVNVLVVRHNYFPVPCDKRAVIEDLDTPEDYRRLQSRDEP